MLLNHVALNILNQEEFKNFYQNILGMKESKSFILNKNLAKNIFNIAKEIPVLLCQKDELYLELAINPVKNEKQRFFHLCISVNNREALLKKAKENNYEAIHIKRDSPDLIFIKDKNGNCFELKEKT
ncbi:VOC family protein [bacterium]|jgi:catechol 2,3-dioxygenase-like lactoylglutathione lyase family enzyme|nr:VOC family protein [bacterium]MBT3581522.1 VOC family protein [bacterium]MBT4551522.1 VOC family protein [bacterium]MBT5988510.1 VOC family protein [bacterium]MBT7087530.1 VOC family protein [bacterium]